MFPPNYIYHILFVTVWCFHDVFSCALKQSTGRREDIAKSVQSMGITDKKFERPLYNKDNKNGHPMCHCSVMDKTYTESSFFYVYSPPKADKKTKIVSCIATVIASNLLLVSHQCLIYFKQNLNLYETWKNANGPKHTPNYTNITIGNQDNPTQLTIKEIILNPIFALSSTLNDKLYEEDVAIIVVNENIFEMKHTSVCLPQVSSRENLDIFYQTAEYSGVGGLHLAKKNPPENRTAPDSVTLPGRECDKDDDFGFKSRKDTICVKFRLPPPLRPGGSLTIKSKSTKNDTEQRNFLVGIATQVGLKVDGNNIEYAYFTNLIPLIKYIEYYAKKYESTWCETPRFVRSETRKPIEAYDWEKPNSVPARDESLDCACGILNGKTAQVRISGGTTTVPYQYPWMAKIFSQWGPGQFSLCGGSIINDKTILTAAHCVVPTHEPEHIAPEHVLKPENADVYVGSHELQNDPNEKKVKVKEIHVFPHFFETAKLNIKDTDVAILMLEQPLDFLKGQTISEQGYRPVCLPKENPKLELVNKTALTIGWGFTKWVNIFEQYPDPGTPADQLQQLTLPILPLSACSKISYYQVTRNMICAGHLNVTKSSLEGDSGGPIMIQNEDKTWLQVGTVSYGDTEPIYDYDTGDVTPGAHATLYANLQTYARFIDYHSSKAGAKWCKPNSKRRRRKRSNFVKLKV